MSKRFVLQPDIPAGGDTDHLRDMAEYARYLARSGLVCKPAKSPNGTQTVSLFCAVVAMVQDTDASQASHPAPQGQSQP